MRDSWEDLTNIFYLTMESYRTSYTTNTIPLRPKTVHKETVTQPRRALKKGRVVKWIWPLQDQVKKIITAQHKIQIIFIRLQSTIVYNTLSFESPPIAGDRPHHQNKKKGKKRSHFDVLWNNTRPQNPASAAWYAYVGLYTNLKSVNIRFCPFNLLKIAYSCMYVYINICQHVYGFSFSSIQ